MQLTIDTSWYTRYRSRGNNPDLDPRFQFAQAVPSLSSGQFPAIPIIDGDLTPAGHIQAIANTAAFHFCSIEQGGTSLYPTLAQKVASLEVLRILLSIGPTKTAHFQTWYHKASNAVSDPLAPLTYPVNPDLVFPNLNAAPFGGEDFQTNLIMPGTLSVPQPHVPGCFHYLADFDAKWRSGRSSCWPGKERSVYRPIEGVFRVPGRSGQRSGFRQARRVSGRPAAIAGTYEGRASVVS